MQVIKDRADQVIKYSNDASVKQKQDQITSFLYEHDLSTCSKTYLHKRILMIKLNIYSPPHHHQRKLITQQTQKLTQQTIEELTQTFMIPSLEQILRPLHLKAIIIVPKQNPAGKKTG